MRFIQYQDIDSTNAEARRRVEQGDKGPLWIRADSQNSGRGRRGREWVSKAGNLFCTGLFPGFGNAQQTAQMSFVASIALGDALDHYVARDLIGLKWPNDVLLDGKKVAGILLEGGEDWVAVGIGVNLVDHPDDVLYPTTHVMDHIPAVSLSGPEPVMTGPQPLLAIVSERVSHWRHRLITEGFEPIREAWLARAYRLPGQMTVRLPNESFSGEAIGLGPNGELQLRLDNGTIRDVHAGDVFFG